MDAQNLLTAANLPMAALPPLPASTSFATLDKNGNAVACALSMNNLFGTGRVLSGLGILLAASPAAVTPPLYCGGNRVERQCPRLPGGGRWLGTGRERPWQ